MIGRSEFIIPMVHKYQVSKSAIKAKAKPAPFEPYKIPDFPVRIPLDGLATEGKATICSSKKFRISVGAATCGRAAGALDTYDKLAKRDWDGKVGVFKAGCLGACYAEPLINLRTPEGKYYFYGNADLNSFWQIIKNTEEPGGDKNFPYLWAIAQERKPGILKGIQDLELIKIVNSGFGQFFEPQVRRISGRCGLVDPENIAEYAAMGGYMALEKALFRLKKRQIIDAIDASGLRGRGGAGFPAADKWNIVSQSDDPVRYVIANADEGDPGAYMDRALLESDPHGVLEGIIIAALAVGAVHAFIFVRHEYPLAVEMLRKAMASARRVGLLGNNILGSNFSLDITLVESGGAFVCGEETSMLQVMEGKRGESQLRPPYPAQQGFRDHPTLINNVETLANIPWIILNGAEAFREIGTPKSPGTKIFCLAGDIRRMGFVEVPLGTSAQVLVEKIGAVDEKSIKALQIGGPSGGIVPYGDFALDYETVAAAGAMIGSGGIVPLAKRRCLVDMAKQMTNFMARESCGKCAICRDGLIELEARLLALTIGQGYKGILEEIKEISEAIAQISLCGLGQTAVNPVKTTLTYFREEYEAHIKGKCPSVSCKPLIDFEIILPCRGCKACYQVCPTDAISMRGKKTGRFIVNPELCIKCWACYETCPFDSIKITSEEYTWKDW